MIFQKQRKEARTCIAVEARVRVGDAVCKAQLLNASSCGMLAAMPQPPVKGTRVQVIVGDMILAGQVRWRGVDCCGIALREPISVADLLDGHVGPAAFIAQPRALRGLGGAIRAFMGERAMLSRPF